MGKGKPIFKSIGPILTMPDAPLILADVFLPGPDATDRLGGVLARVLTPGDTVFLSGPLGAGKSHLARAIIRNVVGDPDLEVASPTYTIVNVYESRKGEVWHADLYRAPDPEDLIELGLHEAMGRAISLIEWPEALAHEALPRLEITLSPATPSGRQVQLRSRHDRWISGLGSVELPQ